MRWVCTIAVLSLLALGCSGDDPTSSSGGLEPTRANLLGWWGDGLSPGPSNTYVAFFDDGTGIAHTLGAVWACSQITSFTVEGDVLTYDVVGSSSGKNTVVRRFQFPDAVRLVLTNPQTDISSTLYRQDDPPEGREHDTCSWWNP